MFYVGDNEGQNSTIFGSNTGDLDFGFMARENLSGNTDDNLNIQKTVLNGTTTSITIRSQAFTATNLHFLLYREIEFNFDDNVLGLGYRQDFPASLGMFTFQELVIFNNTDDAVAKEDNINERYNIY